MELTELKGVGEKRKKAFFELGVTDAESLIELYPTDYVDDSELTPAAQLEDGMTATLHVVLTGEPSIFYNWGVTLVSVRAKDESAALTLRWYNQPYRKAQLKVGESWFVTGRAQLTRGRVLLSPRLSKEQQGLLPIYPLAEGLTQKLLRSAAAEALTRLPIEETLPSELLCRCGLVSRRELMTGLHRPKDREALWNAQRRLAFESALSYFALLDSMRGGRAEEGFAFQTEGLRERFLKKLPFTPTNAQLKAMEALEKDMHAPAPMNRLLQGDVGSGKTVVAAYALAIAAANGMQGVLLAPTELLARQHYEKLKPLFGGCMTLYTGGMSEKDKRTARSAIENGEALVVIGTHALLSDQISFQALGVAVTDEQHRFGVRQRAQIAAKGKAADLLVMSATPIPRTLALLLYGDLDLTVLDELPKGRLPIRTRYIPPNKRDDLYRYLVKQAEDGSLSYVVCPLIERTEGMEGLSVEELCEQLHTKFPKLRVGVLHGRLPEAQKNAVMEAFRAGELRVLLSTTVIEVGVDVPAATTMVIEGADRFGLATLHQLRGRVGRGSEQSYCFLLCDHATPRVKERITALLDCQDGFAIAERDLKQRGAGDVVGLRQHGESKLAQFLALGQEELIACAKAEAAALDAWPKPLRDALLQRAKKALSAEGGIILN